MSNKMWGGRFAEVPPKFVEEFGAVIKVETRLCPYDIQGSLAHVTMLGETGILKAEDVEKIKEELADVMNYAFLIAHKYDLDIKEIILAKLEKNSEKYPVNKAKGNAKKYNEL